MSFAAYIDFFAMRKHFTTSYDYHKYKGKLRRKQDTFEKRKDKYLFDKLGKRKDYHNLLLAVFSRNPKAWITDVLSDDGEKLYIEWKKIMQSLSYIFEQEIKHLPQNTFESLTAYHRTTLLNGYLTNYLSLETLCILMDLTDAGAEMEIVRENVIWAKILEDVENYTPFLKYEKAKMRTIAYRYFQHPVFIDNK